MNLGPYQIVTDGRRVGIITRLQAMLAEVSWNNRHRPRTLEIEFADRLRPAPGGISEPRPAALLANGLTASPPTKTAC